MTAAAILERHHKMLTAHLSVVGHEGRQEERLAALLDAAMAQLALERAALGVLEEQGATDSREHWAAHGRARVALFHLATAPEDSDAFEHALRDLREVFDQRPRALLQALVERADAPALTRLRRTIEATLGMPCPPSTTASSPPRRKSYSDSE